MPGIFFKKWSYDKARVKTFCELVYARKLVKARELQFLEGLDSVTEMQTLGFSILDTNTWIQYLGAIYLIQQISVACKRSGNVRIFLGQQPSRLE